MEESNGYLILWMMAFLVFIIAETVTVRLISIWFAAGSLGAFVAVLLGMPFGMQLMVFLLSAFALILLTRPFTKTFVRPRYQEQRTGRVVGETATVVEEIDNTKPSGRIDFGGLSWSASSYDDTVIETGAQVVIQSVNGTRMTVRKQYAPKQQ